MCPRALPPHSVLGCSGLVRMGLHSGISSELELTYNRASARTVYSGECASVVRVVADSAQVGLAKGLLARGLLKTSKGTRVS